VGFEEGALERLRRYRRGADRTLELSREAEGEARRFARRLFAGLERVVGLAPDAGFEAEATREGEVLALRLVAGPGAEAQVRFGAAPGAAAETDEDLMHEELSRYVLDPSGYSGRVLGWSPNVPGEGPCQTFAVYRDGAWKTKGVLIEKARGRVDDPDDVLGGFCLRILGRLVDLAASTEWAGRRWAEGPYSAEDLLVGRRPPVETRWLH
jgi:hypothetical protein